MKKSRFILVVSVMVIGMFCLSTTAVNAQTPEGSGVKEMVIEAIDYPETAIDKNLEGDVVVKFTPTENGKVEVNEIFSRVPELEEYVHDQISSLELPQSNNVLIEPITLRFTFKLI